MGENPGYKKAVAEWKRPAIPVGGSPTGTGSNFDLA